MPAPSIAGYLKYANLQMTAEAFLVDVDAYGNATVKGGLKKALTDGNEYASRITAQLAEDFLAHWAVVTQKPNTGSGFSRA